MKYTYWEYELIDQMYDDQNTYEYIAEECNRNFHNNEPVRTKNSIGYALKKIFEDETCLDFDWWDSQGLIDTDEEKEQAK
jgi:hypothetical protein